MDNIEIPGTRAACVTAMFESTIVRVTHLDDPRPPEKSPKTTWMIGGGAAALLSALVLFLCAYAHLPTAGVWGDLLGALLVVGGTFALASGLRLRARERAPRDYTVGHARGASFAAPEGALPVGAFPLVRAAGDGWELVFTREMRGEVNLGNETLTLAQLSTRARPSTTLPGAWAWPIADGAHARVELGLSTFHIALTAAPRRQPTPLTLDLGEQLYTAGCALSAAAFLALIHAIPPDPRSLALDNLMKDGRFPVFTVKAPEVPESPLDTPTREKSANRGQKGGGRAKGLSGKMGTPKSQNKAGLYAIEGPKDNKDIRLARALAADAARKAGILGILPQASQIGAIWAPDQSALGDAAQTVMGGLYGTQVQEANGVEGGLGIYGPHKGGGGNYETIGLYNLPTIGYAGKGPNGGKFAAVGKLHPDKVKHAVIDSPQPDVKVKGVLDKEIIRRVVRKHLNEVKFCYESRLMTKPDLYGRVLTEFSIAGTGRVIASLIKQSTLADPSAEQCIAQAVSRWEFPKPDNSGLVIVQYPFAFKQAGSN
jgi:hypothetical protein